MIPLQSGSAGNCVYLESDGVKLLFDAGISAKKIAQCLLRHQIDVQEINAVIISHEHSDHVSGAGVLAIRYQLPIYITNATRSVVGSGIRAEAKTIAFQAGETLWFDNLKVETVSTPHDAVDGVVFVADDGKKRLGILTDFGHIFAWLPGIIESLDAVYLESNYDEDLLQNGPYSNALKRRIQGPGGHISNKESASLIADYGKTLQWAVLAHLSSTNNSPRLALETHRKKYGTELDVTVAPRNSTADIKYL